MVAEIVEAWARARAEATPSRRLTVCTVAGCERPVRARALCTAHYQQADAGKPLKPAWERLDAPVKMGSLRLPAEVAARLKKHAERAGLTVSEAIRRALGAALADVPRLATGKAPDRGRQSSRLGVLRLPADLAERLNVVAQELGLSVAEVVRRAVEAS
jgi:predicted DNA-binding protein